MFVGRIEKVREKIQEDINGKYCELIYAYASLQIFSDAHVHLKYVNKSRCEAEVCVNGTE